MRRKQPARSRASAILGNRLHPIGVKRATPAQIAVARERLRRIKLTAAERGLAPVYVAGAVFLATDILHCQDDPDLVQELQATLGVEVGDHAAIVATAEPWIAEVMADRPSTVA